MCNRCSLVLFLGFFEPLILNTFSGDIPIQQNLYYPKYKLLVNPILLLINETTGSSYESNKSCL